MLGHVRYASKSSSWWRRSMRHRVHHHQQHHQRCRSVPAPNLRLIATVPHASCRDLDEANDIMSRQHSHDDGPWKAMSTAVVAHYNSWHQRQQQSSDNGSPTPLPPPKTFQVLDLACGRLGEPGSTIAHALPLAMVQCTDSCAVVVAAVPTSSSHETKKEEILLNNCSSRQRIPPTNLSKSVVDLVDLSKFESCSMDVITCCYGYNLVPPQNLSLALEEAHRVLNPGGILVVVNWEQSSLLQIGRDVLARVRNNGNNIEDDNDSLFLPPQVAAVEPIYLSTNNSGADAWLQTCVKAGFKEGPAVSVGTYPFNLGNRPRLQFFVGTCTVHEELQSLDALGISPSSAGGWASLAEECFWTSIGKYDTVRNADGAMWLRGNVFKLSVFTK